MYHWDRVISLYSLMATHRGTLLLCIPPWAAGFFRISPNNMQYARGTSSINAHNCPTHPWRTAVPYNLNADSQHSAHITLRFGRARALFGAQR